VVVVDVVDQLDLSRLRDRYRADGCGRAAHDPSWALAPKVVDVINPGVAVARRADLAGPAALRRGERLAGALTAQSLPQALRRLGDARFA
jgi:hypothetical protein